MPANPPYQQVPEQNVYPYGAPGSGPSINTQIYIAQAPTKSVGLAVLLAFLFGPLGVLYASVPAALIMIATILVGGAVAFLLFPITSLLLFVFAFIPTGLISMIVAGVCASEHNAKVTRTHTYQCISYSSGPQFHRR